ncbi:MAG: general secretion pathway protein GspD [Planctomycetes bacterium]|nr:general secretion pathway protein GspD [Planctomycetota bacterium]
MKATTSFAAWSISFALPLVLGGSVMSHSALAVKPFPATGNEPTVRGQSPGTVTDPDAREMLRLARAAMERQQWGEAEVLIQRAEQRWGMMHNPFGDSPKAARRDLQRLSAGGAPQKPSDKARPSLLAPLSGGSSRADAKDPFANGSANVEAVLDNKKPAALEHLKNGRLALKQGNLPAAAYYAGKATELGATFAPGEDSPQQLTADIQARGGRVSPPVGAADAALRRLPEIGANVPQDGISPLPQHSSNNYDTSLPPLRGPAPEMGLGGRGAASSFGNDNLSTPAGARPAAAPATPGQVDRYAARAAVYDPQFGPAGQQPVSSAVYDPRRDGTRNMMVAGEEGEVAPPPPGGPVAREADSVRLLPMNNAGTPPTAAVPPATPQGEGEAAPPHITQANKWIQQGDMALKNRDRKSAMEFYSKAMALRDQLDPQLVQQLQDRMQLAQAVAPGAPMGAAAGAVPGAEGNRLLDEAGLAQQRLRQQVGAQMNREMRKAEEMQEKDPRGALNQLKNARAIVEQSALSPTEKKGLLARVDRAVKDTEKYIEQHRTDIELTERNDNVQGEVDRRRAKKVQVQEKLALLVDEFNKLRDEQRFAEAEAIAKQAMEIAPDEQVSTQLYREVRFWRNVQNNRNMSDDQDNANVAAWLDVERAGVPMDASQPLQFGPVKDWTSMTDRRRKYAQDRDRKRSPKEIEIEQKLRSPVSLKFRETPLSEVIDRLKEVTGINIYLDPQGLAQEGVHPSSQVTIDLSQDISLKSALNLILQPLHLGYVVRDEVLKITSEQHRSGNVYTKVYMVADLVIPIPDFAPHNRIGLPQQIDDAYNRTNANIYGTSGFQAPVAQLAAHTTNPSGMAGPDTVLGQQTSGGGITTGGNRGGTGSANFDGLIDLITKTIEAESWDEVGGAGSMKPSPSNLSLVITQTQEVHERITDLLDQLRRLQDLQVTIEVRFITLSDNFFERIGVDFDFNIRSNANAADVARANSGVVMKPSATLGLLTPTDTNPAPNFVPNGAIPFTQNSFDSAIPPFGGFNPASAATFGIAILSDLEAFFLVQAAQGDVRTNIMQAPKVTLFNGQAASISDQSQTPFVTSVTPVVGDFAAAQAPVIVVLNEGTTLSVQAVVSQDRRFVRLTLIPFFSQIKDVKEFQFTGSTTTKTSSSDSSQDDGDNTSESGSSEVIKEGTTVQLPTFAFTTVTTTVSVPDGGTVLLGGIKRLKEGRNEFGIPIMSKIPYINRLFKNVGIGREAQSLMLMVTPRIIIQEEEEEKLGLAIPEETASRRLDRR